MGTLLEIVIPDIGDDEEVEVIEVLVKTGDVVAVDDPLVTLESDKASLDVPSTNAGRISSIAVTPGDRVRMGSTILVLETESTHASVPAAEPNREAVANDVTRAAIGAGTTTANDTPAVVPDSPSDNATTSSKMELRVPDVGTDEAVEVIEILIAVGESVNVDDGIITLESDKASMDVPSTHDGHVNQIHVSVGDQVFSGDLIATLASSAASANPVAPRSATAPEPAAGTQAAQTRADTTTDSRPTTQRRGVAAAPAAVADAAGGGNGAASSLAHASPSVRRFARELGADLNQISGTGRKGRILAEDVQQWVKARLEGTSGAAATAGGTGGLSIPPLPVIDFSQFGPIETVRMSRIKRISGPHLQRAWLNAPHVTHHDEADITDLEEFRKSMKNEVAKQDINLTPLVFIMRAVVAALKAFPQLNASLSPDGESLIYKKYFNIGIAVDTPDGLVVPVIRDVDQKGYIDLARELGEVSVRARDGALKPADIKGGCFSISSLGGIGGTAFTPIINVPEVAILGVARAQMKPVWDGEAFGPRRILPLDLSYDHRAIDGAEAARFTRFIALGLSDIRRLSL